MNDVMASCQSSVAFELNPELDRAELSRLFGVNQRLQVRSILQQQGADALHRYLSTEMEWSLLVAARKKTFEVAPEAAGQRDAQANRRLLDYAYGAARDGFAFVYGTNRRKSRQPSANDANLAASLLVRFGAFLNSAAFLSLLREITGRRDLRYASAQATCFLPGHFLNFHTDAGEGGNYIAAKKMAYVFNLSRGWSAAWGGLLQFEAADGSLCDSFVPLFNSLNIFSVPQSHAVSMVAPFAGSARYAVSGWLHTD